MPAAKGGDSKQATVVTLVFFILLSLGLMVFAYVGWSGQEKLTTEKDRAEKMAKDDRDDKESQRAMAILLRSYTGNPPADKKELQLLYERYKREAGKDGGKGDKDGTAKALEQIEQELGWDAQQNLPKSDTKRVKADLEKKLKESTDLVAQKDEELGKRLKELQSAKAAKDAFEVEYKKKLDELNVKAKEELDRYGKSLEGQRTDYGESGKTIAALKEDIDKKIDDYTKVMKGKDKEIKDLQTQLARLADKKPNYSAIAFDRPKGKIVLMDKTGQLPYINLGSADRVKPQLTFAVHGIGADGRPLKDSKGSLEVIHVVNEHLSQTKVTGQVNPTRDPIATGDVILNAAWDPSQPQHVAIAGIVDLTGNVRKDRPAEANRALEEFKRSLEAQNIVVDAWLDFVKGTIEGKGITGTTDFLIRGELPEETSSKVSDESKGKARDDLRKLATKMQEDATRAGVPIIKVREFLIMTGYRLPRLADDDNVNKIRSTVPAAGSPVQKSNTPPADGAGKEK